MDPFGYHALSCGRVGSLSTARHEVMVRALTDLAQVSGFRPAMNAQVQCLGESTTGCHCTSADLGFILFALDVCGVIDLTAVYLLSSFASAYSKNLSKSYVYALHICRRRISFALQTGISRQLSSVGLHAPFVQPLVTPAVSNSEKARNPPSKSR